MIELIELIELIEWIEFRFKFAYIKKRDRFRQSNQNWSAPVRENYE